MKKEQIIAVYLCVLFVLCAGITLSVVKRPVQNRSVVKLHLNQQTKMENFIAPTPTSVLRTHPPLS